MLFITSNLGLAPQALGCRPLRGLGMVFITSTWGLRPGLYGVARCAGSVRETSTGPRRAAREAGVSSTCEAGDSTKPGARAPGVKEEIRLSPRSGRQPLEITFVVFDPIRFEKFYELIPERNLSMVLFLLRYITLYLF